MYTRVSKGSALKESGPDSAKPLLGKEARVLYEAAVSHVRMLCEGMICVLQVVLQ